MSYSEEKIDPQTWEKVINGQKLFHTMLPPSWTLCYTKTRPHRRLLDQRLPCHTKIEKKTFVFQQLCFGAVKRINFNLSVLKTGSHLRIKVNHKCRGEAWLSVRDHFCFLCWLTKNKYSLWWSVHSARIRWNKRKNTSVLHDSGILSTDWWFCNQEILAQHFETSRGQIFESQAFLLLQIVGTLVSFCLTKLASGTLSLTN